MNQERQKELYYNLQNINDIAKIVIRELESIKILLLFGDLGAGKTTLVKYIVKILGGDYNEVTSPTFNLQHVYNTKNQKIYHFDLYRINSLEELYNLGVDEALNNGLLIFEWGEIAKRYFNCGYLKLDINFCENDNKRKILFTYKNA